VFKKFEGVPRQDYTWEQFIGEELEDLLVICNLRVLAIVLRRLVCFKLFSSKDSKFT